MEPMVLLEAAIGLVLIYLALSLVASAATEIISQARGLHGKNLRLAIRRLFNDDAQLVADLYAQPRIRALQRPLGSLRRWVLEKLRCWDKAHGWLGRHKAFSDRDPSYIEPATFAKALLDMTTDGRWKQGAGSLAPVLRSYLREFSATPAASSSSGQSSSTSQRAQLAVRLNDILDEAGGDAEKFVGLIGHWYDETMDRSRGWFRRGLSKWLLLVGFAIAAFTNANTVTIFKSLTANGSLRSAMVEAAVKRVSPDEGAAGGNDRSADPVEPKGCTNDQMKAIAAGKLSRSVCRLSTAQVVKQELGDVQPVLGWSDSDPVIVALKDGHYGDMAWELGKDLPGLLITALAISLGAPFWFNLLQQLVKIRASLRPGEPTDGGSASPGGSRTKPEPGPGALGAPPALVAAASRTGAPAQGPDRLRRGMPGFAPHTMKFDVANAHWLACAADLAYQGAGPDPVKGTAGVAATCRDWGFECETFEHKDETVDTQGFVAWSSDCLLIAFRGTEPSKIKDITTDLIFDAVPATALEEMPKGARVHKGFMAALDPVWHKVCGYVNKHGKARTIWVAGHSLGGALAVLAAYRLAVLGWQSRRKGFKHPVLTGPIGTLGGLYTIGQPRVGNEAFAETVDRQLRSRYFRVVNNRDIVPRIPTRFMGFEHAGEVIYFDDFGRLHRDPGLWFRLLDTVVVSMDDLKDQALETVKDHSASDYCALLAGCAGDLIKPS